MKVIIQWLYFRTKECVIFTKLMDFFFSNIVVLKWCIYGQDYFRVGLLRKLQEFETSSSNCMNLRQTSWLNIMSIVLPTGKITRYCPTYFFFQFPKLIIRFVPFCILCLHSWFRKTFLFTLRYIPRCPVWTSV